MWIYFKCQHCALRQNYLQWETLISRSNNSATDLSEKENNQIMINMGNKVKTGRK